MDTKARDEATEHWIAGSELFEKLRFELAQLDLIAGPDVRAVATTLVREHESVQHWIRPASGADDWYKLLTEQNNKIVRLHEELVDKTRAELGLDPTPSSSPGSPSRLLSRSTPGAARRPVPSWPAPSAPPGSSSASWQPHSAMPRHAGSLS